MLRKKIALGSDYFPKLIAPDVLYIDKSPLIGEIIEDKSEVILFTRPRRWGKTLNMSMLQHFFAPKVFGRETKGLFDYLKIAQEEGGRYMQYQGKSPVIFISLKDVVGNSFDEIYENIKRTVIHLFNAHTELYNSDKLSIGMRKEYAQILKCESSKDLISNSLAILSQCLYEYYQQKVYILIDEYDAPLNHAYKKEYFEQLVTFVRNFLSSGLKTNPCLEKGILTGIFRVAKANIFSGLNNVKEYTLLNERYSKYFGFTEEEIVELCNPRGEGSPYLKGSLAEIKEWYDGYAIGKIAIYNPWSIMNYIEEQKVQAYWIESGGNQLIEDMLLNSNHEVKQKLEQLIQGKPVEVTLDKFTAFNKMTTNSSAFWSLLFNAGYLTIDHFIGSSPGTMCTCQVRIPNKEVAVFYLQIMKSWLDNVGGEEQRKGLIDALLEGNADKFEKDLKYFLITSFSSFDVGGENPERVYHAFMMGLMAHMRESYDIKSNRESGEGRYDVLLKPKDKSALAIIFEFKSIAPESSPVQLQEAAVGALNQIKEKKYESELDQEGIKQRLLIGVAFAGKNVEIRYERKITVEFNPQAHVEAYKRSSSSLTWPSTSSCTTFQCEDSTRRIFGSVVGIGETVVGDFEGQEIKFDIYRTGGEGHCGFYSLPIPYDRKGVVELLLKHSSNERIRQLVTPEIIETLKAGYLPKSILNTYSQLNKFIAYQNSVDKEQQSILVSVLDILDPNRTLIQNREFESVMRYLIETNTSQEQLAKMQKFKLQHEAQLKEFHIFFQSEEMFKAFIQEYVGKDGELSFAVGGINFAKEHSLLDAILEIAEPPLRLCIWEREQGSSARVKIVYRGGKAEAPISHIHHASGKDTHFSLMAYNVEPNAQKSVATSVTKVASATKEHLAKRRKLTDGSSTQTSARTTSSKVEAEKTEVYSKGDIRSFFSRKRRAAEVVQSRILPASLATATASVKIFPQDDSYW